MKRGINKFIRIRNSKYILRHPLNLPLKISLEQSTAPRFVIRKFKCKY